MAKKFASMLNLTGKNNDGFCAIYLIGPKEKEPLKVGIGLDPFARLTMVQVGNWTELFIHYNVWVADIRLARKVESQCHKLLDQLDRHVRGEWYGIELETGKRVIEFAAKELNIPLHTNSAVNDYMTLKEQVFVATMLNEIGDSSVRNAGKAS